MGGTLLSVGDLDASKQHFEAALAAYDERHPQRSALGSDLGVFANAWYTHTVVAPRTTRTPRSRAPTGDRARPATRPLVQRDPRARVCRGSFTRCVSTPSRVLACAEAAVDAVRAIRIRVLRRLGAGADWLGTRAERPARRHRDHRIGARATRSAACAGAPAILLVACWPKTYSRLGHARSRGIDPGSRRSRWRSSEAIVWWLPALYLQKSELGAAAEREATLQRALALARAQHSRALEQRILASSIASASRQIGHATGCRKAYRRELRERFRERFGNARPHRLFSRKEAYEHHTLSDRSTRVHRLSLAFAAGPVCRAVRAHPGTRRQGAVGTRSADPAGRGADRRPRREPGGKRAESRCVCDFRPTTTSRRTGTAWPSA